MEGRNEMNIKLNVILLFYLRNQCLSDSDDIGSGDRSVQTPNRGSISFNPEYFAILNQAIE